MRSERRNLVIFGCLLLAALVSFYAPFLCGQQSFYLSDLSYDFEPQSRFIGQSLRLNRLPLWNPYLFCGMSQIALPSPGIFYPLQWLFAWLSFNRALAIYMIFHQLLAGLGGFLLVADCGWGSLAASVGGLILALTGYMFSFQKNFTLAATAAWLPVTLWCCRRIGAGGTARHCAWTVLSALAVFMIVAAGRPEVGAPALAFTAGDIALAACLSWRRDGSAGQAARTAAWRLLAVATGVLISMPIVLPVAEWVGLSPRASGLDPGEVLFWSANWYDWLMIALAQPLGDLNLIGARFLCVVATRPAHIPFLPSAFIGPVALTLALWGCADRSWPGRRLVAAVFLSGAIAATGAFTPVFPWLIHNFPSLGMFRYPVKLLIVPVWCIALLAARGAMSCLAGPPARPARLLPWIVWTLTALTGVALSTTAGAAWLAVHARGLANPGVDQSLLAAALVLVGQAALRAAAAGAATCAGAELFWRRRIPRRVFSAVIVAGCAGSMLACAFMFYRHGTEPGFFAHDSYLGKRVKELADRDEARLGSQFRVLPLYFDPLARPPWYHGSSLAASNACFYQYARQLLLPNTNLDFHVRSSFGYESAQTADFKKIFFDALAAYRRCSDVELAKFCKLTATRYVATQVFKTYPQVTDLRRLDPRLFELVLEDRSMNVRVFRTAGGAPRAYLVGDWQWCRSHKEAMDKLPKLSWGASTTPRRALVEHRSDYRVADDPQPSPGAERELAGSWVRFLQDEPEHIALSVKADAACLLILADHFYPGWHARVDGVAAEIFRANAFERAVYLRGGPHLIEFDYEPESLSDGMRLATLAVCVLAGLIGVAAYKMLAASARSARAEIHAPGGGDGESS